MMKADLKRLGASGAFLYLGDDMICRSVYRSEEEEGGDEGGGIRNDECERFIHSVSCGGGTRIMPE